MSVSDDSLHFISDSADPSGASTATSDRAPAPQIPSKISLIRSSSAGASSKLNRKNADKVGRWSDDEHQVFLAGLEKHGKQWKTIATMIGTRTVVQVRTHAQKYFQKLERKTKSDTVEPEECSLALSGASSKRKSLPSALPSDQERANKVHKPDASVAEPSKVDKPRISISISNISSCAGALNLPTPTLNESHPISAFSCSSSSENLSTVSPAGVNELDLGLWGCSTDPSFYLDNAYQGGVVDDPLEWFNLDSPDAPIFPDFQESLDIQHTDNPKSLSVVEMLPCMDPKVTVQSLFLDEQPLHM